MSQGTTRRVEEYRRRQEDLAGWTEGIVSYRLGDRYRCEVDNVSPGARVARGEGAAREEAERQALDKTRERLLAHPDVSGRPAGPIRGRGAAGTGRLGRPLSRSAPARS